MWKRIVIACITMVGALSVGYAYYNRKLEAVNTANGGTISGTLGSLKKGDRFYIYTNDYPFVVVGTDQGTLSSGTLAIMDQVVGNINWNNNNNLYSASDYRSYIQSMNNAIDSQDITYPIIKEFVKPQVSGLSAHYFTLDMNALPSDEMKYFIGATSWFTDHSAINGATSSDLETYLIDNTWLGHIWTNGWFSPLVWSGGAKTYDSSGTTARGIQPGILLNNQDVVFAASKPSNSGSMSTVMDNGTDRMQLRMKSNALTVDFDSVTVNHNGIEQNVTNIVKGTSLVLHYSNATTGNGNTISVIVTKDGKWKFYKRLEIAQGSGSATIETDNWEEGTYNLALVNETLTNDINPTVSSQLTASKSITVVKSHKITYAKTPQAGATHGDYEYTKNVNEGDIIGKITLNPTGVLPITYRMESNGDNTYENFEIDGLNSNGASSATSLNVKIKANANDLDNGFLKAGTYKFCIASVDANGYPATQTSDTKVCTSLTVAKTDLTVQFNQPNQTKKAITEAANDWNETATANPSNGTKITYTKTGGDIGLINLDPNTGTITYTGNNAFGKVKIRATADDDPATGNDNYNSAFVEKEVVIYREVNGVITPDANSSDTTIPTFTASDVNVRTGGTIGRIQGTLGTPDNITSGTTTYTYGLKNTGDGSFFTVNSNSGEIKSNANLAVGAYHITVTVSDRWSTKELPVTINVGVAAAENLKFYENSSSSTVINTKTVNFTDTNVNVFATVRGSTNNNPVRYEIQDGSTNVIEINPTSGAITIRGAGTVTIVATKQGASGQANARAELTFTVSTGAQNFIYNTDSTLQTEMPKTNGHYDAYTESYAPNKTFRVYTSGNPSGSTVTYRLKDGSPTDVISVDSDGTIHVLNASTNNQIGRVIVQAISHDPAGNYDDKTIELPINIEKGTRVIDFAEHPINVINGSGSISPTILTDGVVDTSGNTVIEINPGEDSSIAWTNDGETIHYNWNDANGKDIRIHVTKPADRNYRIAEADGILHILGADESALTLSTPGRIIYGDHFTIRSTQDDSMSTNVQYTFTTDNGVFISAPQVNGNRAEFDALAYSGNTEITITVTRTADGELPLSKRVKIKVLPKPITIEIEDKEKERLEENPPLTYSDFTPQLVTWNGVRDTIDESVIRLSTTAGKYSPIGTYPITAGNAQALLNDNYPNYTFTIKNGKLNIKDNGNKNFWDIDDDGCPDLNITVTDDEGNTILINGDRNDDGIPDCNIDTNGDGKPDLNIDTDHDERPDLNLVILKEWKPSRCVELDGIRYSSGINAKAEINIDLDGDNIPDIDIDTDGDFKADYNIDIDHDGEAEVNIGKVHTLWKPDNNYTYKSFAYDTMKQDQPLLNIDTDGDGCPDVNLDLDGDGTPDLNVDHDGDLIPETDIDSTGDGKADINIDTDGDGTPDENITEITEWKAETKIGKMCTMLINPDDTGKDPNDPKQPSDDEEKPSSDVQGEYYPGANMGGASTGDTTNIMMYLGLGCMSIGMMLLILYKRKQAD